MVEDSIYLNKISSQGCKVEWNETLTYVGISRWSQVTQEALDQIKIRVPLLQGLFFSLYGDQTCSTLAENAAALSGIVERI